MLPSEDDNVQFNILLEAAQALKELEYLRTDATTLQEVFDAVQAKVDATARKMGTSFTAMEQNFKDVIALSARLRAEMDAMGRSDATALLKSNPQIGLLSQVQSPFGGSSPTMPGIAQATGWAEVNAIQKEVLKNQMAELKLADATAKEINEQAAAEKKKSAERQKAVALAQKELELVEREAQAILQGGGAIRRTAQESMQLLRSFSTTQRGQGMLAQFFGDYNGATNVTQQIDTVKKAITSLSKETKTSFGQAGQLIKEQFSNIPGMASQVNQAVKQMGAQFEDGSLKAVKGLDAVRIAMGAIISMIIFQAIQAVTNFFTEAGKQAQQLEDTLYRLGNVEKTLSLKGIEISLKGLEDGITRIQKKMPIFSRENVSQMVGTLAISTQQLGLNEKQILDLAEAVAVLNVRSEKTEDLSTTAQHVLSSLLTGNAKGMTSLGIAFTDNTMRAMAMKLQFLEADEALSELSENEKGLTKLAIILESTGQELESITEYLDTNSAKIQANKAAWQDLLTTVGQTINNLKPDMTGFYADLQKGFEGDKVNRLFTRGLQDAVQEAGNYGPLDMGDGAIKWKLFFRVDLAEKELERVKEILSGLDQAEIKKMFPDPSAIKDEKLRAIIESLIEIKDTATGIPDPLVDADVDADALLELEQAIEDIAIEAQHAREDLAILLGQKQEDLEIKFQLKLEDLDMEYLQKAEDAAIDYAHKIEDINLEAQQKIEDLKNKARLEEERAEKEFQLKMKELREQFLLDLEDALHNRDARQVIRLQKQYALDKQKLIDRKNLEDELREDQLQADLEAIELERQRKLEAAAQEYQQKLEQLAISKQRELDEINRWKAREEQDLALWHQRELEEIDRNTRHKLERLLAGYIEEEKLHEESQAAIHEILARWFGENMALVDQLTAYTAQAFANMALSAGAAFAGIGAAMPALPGSMGGDAPAPYWDLATQGPQMAEGGTLFADRPTTVTFGENGPEEASFRRIGRVGRDEGTLFSNMSGNDQGMDGKLVLELLLSPDLEAKIIDKSLNRSADIITKITRTKN